MHKINKFIPMSGHHCITNSLRQIFYFCDYPISEAMLFGIGRGINFLYLNLSNSPMISGRIKPFEFEQNIADALKIDLKLRKPASSKTAMKKLIKSINSDSPVLVYVDMAYLPFMNMPDSHFGGHSIVVFGYDASKNIFLVSDRDGNDFAIQTPGGPVGNDFHEITYEDLEKARNSKFRPFPANNKYIEMDFGNVSQLSPEIIFNAIKQTTYDFLNPPAKLLGICGIEKFFKEIMKWKSFSEEKLKTAAITNYFMISRKGGTSGGALRKMYAEFLSEASQITNIPSLMEISEQFLDISKLWDNIADKFMHLHEKPDTNIIDTIQDVICKIYIMEKEAFEELNKIATR